jgi:cobalt/nickel transport system permease protein
MSAPSSLLLRSSDLLAGPSYVTGLDPRARIVAAVAFSLVVALARGFPALGAALAVAALAVAAARLRPRAVLARLVPLNLLLLLLAVLLPLSAGGPPVWQIGPLEFSEHGLLLAARVALKGNAILLALVLLLGTMEIGTLGHALDHLYVPDKLSHLLLFTVRYLDVHERQFRRLSAAMRLRAFRPRLDVHTLRAYGHLVGMLLVRSFDRAERIVAAMKCRGFRGHFWMLDHFAWSRRDSVFVGVFALVLLALVLVERL